MATNRVYRAKRKEKAIKVNKSISKKDNFMIKSLKKLIVNVIDSPIENAILEYETFNNKKISNVKDDFIERITLNYIRHKHTNYIILAKNFKYSSDYELSKFKQRVNEIIKRKYKGLV